MYRYCLGETSMGNSCTTQSNNCFSLFHAHYKCFHMSSTFVV